MTSCTFRRYPAATGFTPDFTLVRDFLLHLNYTSLRTPNFVWGRWEWVFCRSHQDTSALDRIGIWEDAGAIVALATYEDQLGETFLVAAPGYTHLQAEMFAHAEAHLAGDEGFKPVIDDHDTSLQRVALARGYRSTQMTQPTSIIFPDAELGWTLPPGYRIAVTADDFDVRRFNRCLHRGFNHPGEPDESEAELTDRLRQVSGPHQNRSLNFVVIAPNGDYASYCGIWYQPGEATALVEPVCTDSTYRRLGLGRAAVLSGVKAAFAAGAQNVIVGSEQEFYYSIGFAPIYNAHLWTRTR